MIYSFIKGFPVELFLWTGGLLLFAFTRSGSDHYTLCPLDNLGISWCPGCGLGRSIRYFFQGEFQASFSRHWFGIPATFILIYRIIELINNLLNLNTSKR
ncbi:DUF2752 domain-containing protein [Daejeonella sp. H1SJ63]|uniref:DUF2752 domain-containing protein n=1 Tax=Daejeonella sp. H1SJ63 TaxID=3034145 RepID=UPI0023EDF71F|nr:DUF2752 domain-containing protein [Daejeonella sp. H1SJ63]